VKIKIYETIILRVVLYGCEIWYLTLRQEHRLRMFSNKVLRRIFGLKRDETGGQRKLCNEKLHNFYPLPNTTGMYKSRRMGWLRHVACMGEKGNAHSVSMGKPEDRRPRHRWEDNTEMDLREIEWWGRDWIHLAQDRD
jgi:hypothetical protein